MRILRQANYLFHLREVFNPSSWDGEERDTSDLQYLLLHVQMVGLDRYDRTCSVLVLSTVRTVYGTQEELSPRQISYQCLDLGSRGDGLFMQ